MKLLDEIQKGSIGSAGEKWFSVCCLLLGLTSAFLILCAAQGDLWLDEIWSLSYAQQANSIAEVFTHFKHDNNHPLNTLFMYLVGEQSFLPVYRILAILSGVGSVTLSGYVAKKNWGKPEALISMTLMGCSYPMLLYFSEARGYGPAVFFGLACYALLNQNPEDKNRGRITSFWAASILGILSHATFIILSLSFLGWSLAREMYSFRGYKTAARTLIRIHGPPLGFFAFWYLYFLHKIVIGRGPEYDAWTVLGQTGSLLLGFPDDAVFRIPSIFLMIVLGFSGIAAIKHDRRQTRFFFGAVILFSPLMVMLLASPDFLYFRYFIVCFPFYYLLLAQLTVHSFLTSSRILRVLIVIAFGLVLCGHLVQDIRLVKVGRGQYTAALQYIVSRSDGQQVTIGSDHDFRNNALIRFYAPRVTNGATLRYITRSEWDASLPTWIITHHQSTKQLPLSTLSVKGHPTASYGLRKEFRYSGISGWNWFVYRLEET